MYPGVNITKNVNHTKLDNNCRFLVVFFSLTTPNWIKCPSCVFRTQYVDHTKLDNNCRFLLVFSEQYYVDYTHTKLDNTTVVSITSCVFFFVDRTKLDNNCHVFSEQSTIMDIYVQVGNKVALVTSKLLDIKKLCLAQKKCIEELTKKNLSLQDKNDELHQTILQKKVKKLDDLNKLTKRNLSLQQQNDKLQIKLDDLDKGYSEMLKELGFDEDNSLVAPHTPEKTSRIHKTRDLSTLNKKELFDSSTTTPPRKKRKQSEGLNRGRELVERVNNDVQSSKPPPRRSSLRNKRDNKRVKKK